MWQNALVAVCDDLFLLTKTAQKKKTTEFLMMKYKNLTWKEERVEMLGPYFFSLLVFSRVFFIIILNCVGEYD